MNLRNRGLLASQAWVRQSWMTSSGAWAARLLSPTLVIGYYLAFAGAMAWLVPVFEAPDESAHLDYVNFIAQTWSLPNQYDQVPPLLWEGHQPPLYYAVAGALVSALKRDSVVNVPPIRNRRHAWAGGRSRDVPEYDHAYHSPFVRAADRAAFYGLRCVSILMGLGTLLLAEQICRCFVGSSRWALLAALLIATLPQFAFISATVNNDNAANLLSAAAIYCLLGLMDHPYRLRLYAAFGFVVGLGLLAKKTALFLLPSSALVLGYLVWVNRRTCWRVLRGASLAVAIAVLTSAWMFSRNHYLYGDWLGSRMEEETLADLVLRKQLLTPYFLGRLDTDQIWGPLAGFFGREVAAYVFPLWVLLLAAMYVGVVSGLFVIARTRIRRFLPSAIFYTLAVSALTVVYSNYFFTGYKLGPFWPAVGESFVGRMGPMSVPLPTTAYGLYVVLAVVAGAGLCAHLWHRRLRDPKVLAALLLTGTAVAGLVHYNLTFAQPQGRLLFPALTLVAALATLGLKTIADLIGGRTITVLMLGSLVVGLVACDLTALVRISSYFYNPEQYGVEAIEGTGNGRIMQRPNGPANQVALSAAFAASCLSLAG
jgi:4-amino-4-deoxy-L-arabinose transferase-like glycosyltransferase